jgi:glycosyltransferase involved in cell wall biosynthesis
VISVILCTHNPRPDYLEMTLEGLRGQTLPSAEWELVVVDNACEPALDEDTFSGVGMHARVVRENTLGLTPARLHGIREAQGEILVFVDDDNILDADYLERAAMIATDNPHLGAWGGQSAPRFERTPPEWTRRYWGSLVIRELSGDRWSNIHYLHETMPAGAGLCVRRSVARHYDDLHRQGARSTVLDRTGNQLLSGGDTDLACCAFDVGLGAGTFSDLRLVHLIPASRLDESYLLGLVEGIAYSGVILRSYRSNAYLTENRRGLRGRLADSLRLAMMSSRERRFQRARLRGEARARRDLASRRETPG